MVAVYYLSQSIGKRKKDNEPLYIVNVIGVDRWGTLKGDPLFLPSHEDYKKILDMHIAPGTPINIQTTWQGAFVGLEVDKRYKPLCFDEPITNPSK